MYYSFGGENIRRKAIATIVVIILLLTGFGHVLYGNVKEVRAGGRGGDILYVGGSGPNNYTKIQDAIDNASDGDIVYVFSGTYYENVFVDKTINLIGEDKDTTIIDGGYNDAVVSLYGLGGSISGFTIQHGGGEEILGPGIFVDADNTSIIGNNIIDNSYNGIHLGSVSHTNIIGNTLAGGDIGIFLGGFANNNIIYHNNLLDNTQNAYDEGINNWYNATLQEGNYWSDYLGDDANDDGIGDTSHPIPGGINEDLYPFMVPDGWEVITDDLSISDIKCIQVIEDASALIMDKKSVVCAHVYNSFDISVKTEIKVTYDFGGSIYIERGPLGDGVPLSPGLNRVYIPGGPTFPSVSNPWLPPDDGPWLYWTNTGMDNNIKVEVDPFNNVCESIEGNNEMATQKKICESKQFNVLVFPVYFPLISQSPYSFQIDNNMDYLLATYPVADNKFVWHQSPLVALPWRLPKFSLEFGLYDWLYKVLAVPLTIVAILYGYDRVVIVEPALVFAGVALGVPGLRTTVFVGAGQLWRKELTAHELGHSYSLHHPHDIGPPEFNATRYWVSKRDYEMGPAPTMNSFMSYRDVSGYSLWIDKLRYDVQDDSVTGLVYFAGDPLLSPKKSPYWWDFGDKVFRRWNLFDQFKIGPDPEVIVLTGIIFENGTITADRPWYRVSMGTPDLDSGASGDFNVVLLDEQGYILDEFGFNASCDYFGCIDGNLTEVHSDSIPFVFKIPYLFGTTTIEIRNSSGDVLVSRTVTANPPAINITFPNGGEVFVVGDDVDIMWDASDLDGDKLTYVIGYSLDGGGNWTPLAFDISDNHYTWNTSNLPPGNRYMVRVTATDGVNIGEDVSDDAFTLKTDVIPPTTTKIVSQPKYGPNNEWVNLSTTIWLNATDNINGSGVNFTHYEIWWDQDGDGTIDTQVANVTVYDNDANDSDSTLGNISVEFNFTEECLHELRWYSSDNAGNVEEVHNQTHYVDDTPPTSWITPSWISYRNPSPNTKITIHANDSGACAVGLYWIYYQIYRDGAMYKSGTGNLNSSVSFYLPLGNYTIEYWAVDTLGNEEQHHITSFSVVPTKPPTPPDTTIIFDGPHEWNKTHWQIIPETKILFKVNTHGHGLKETRYRIDKGNWIVFTIPFSIMEGGMHEIFYFSVDRYDIRETLNAAWIEVVSSLAPLTTCTLNPSSPNGNNGWYVNDVTITLTAIDDVSGVDSTYYKIDNDNWRKYTNSITINEDGEHTISFYSIDKVGNEEEVKLTTFKIDKTNPTINIKKPTYGYLYLFGREIIPLKNTVIIGKALITVTANDETSGIDKVEFYVDDELKNIDTSPPYEWLWDETTFFKHWIKVIAYDKAGNTASDEIEIIIFNI